MKYYCLLSSFLLLFIPFSINAQMLENSKHNLSAMGRGNIKASGESQTCIFCHTSHSRGGPKGPMWNRNDQGRTYILYNSSTIDAIPGQPDGSSILCLSCHDGTTALGNIRSRSTHIGFGRGVTRMPHGSSNLSTDLSDDHPISFVYNASLTGMDGQLKDPETILEPVSLENEKVQCTSCHDPHSELFEDFLVVTNQFSDLCFHCHERNYWGSSSHNLSIATWNGSGINPWPHTTFTSVTENACENCHNPHSAGGKPRLMNYLAEEQNCLFCHNGNVAETNIETQLVKSYSHNVYAFNLQHDPTEEFTALNLHVECEDCHNPHAVRKLLAVAPNVNGYIEGVKGVNSSGIPIFPVQYEYEICFRCHADSPLKPASTTGRQIEQSNVRLEFDLSNPSFHPVVSTGVNPNVPSLISPLTEASQIYCSDCHASDGSDSPAGPHGSIYPAILKYRYDKADNTIESSLSYELCYSCHDRNSILNDRSFKDHNKHIRDVNTPCNACHDPHGISSTQGNSSNNSHLINFDRGIVKPDSQGRLYFEDMGNFRGRCFLTCHGEEHNPESY